MSNQTKQGKAFEYACLKSFKEVLRSSQEVEIVSNSAYLTARNFYYASSTQSISKYDAAAAAATRVILRLEPQLQNPDDNKPLLLIIQEDVKGIQGDVRDVLCIRKQNEWEIGFSCKHNHTAVKHSRLSSNLDFGNSWFNIPCSKEYFDAITPIFHELKLKRESGILWRDVRDKEANFYYPILTAFQNEIFKLDVANPEKVPHALISYLLGKNDFYKIITHDSRKTTQIQAFNLNGTLNRGSKLIKAESKIPHTNYPKRLLDLSFKSGTKTTLILTCDNGWAVSFRIHNASRVVEPSLKFDIQLIGIPQSLFSQTEPW